MVTKSDIKVLKKVFEGRQDLEIKSASDFIKNKDKGGKDNLVNFIKDHLEILRCRISPILIIFDWDTDDSYINSVNNHFRQYGLCIAGKLQEKDSNPELSSDIHGIEKFYDTKFFKETLEKLKVPILSPPGEDYPLTVKYKLEGGLKQQLANEYIMHRNPGKTYLKNYINLCDELKNKLKRKEITT